MTTETLVAPAKLTLSLSVTGRRPDGYHQLDAEMVSIDLVDSLTFGPGDSLSVVDEVVGGVGTASVPAGPDNLVVRALALVGRRAAVRVVKRIPAGAGLGGGSADAAAALRWAGVKDVAVAARLGSDVPFCLHGGRARVGGVGETLEPLPYERRRFVLLVPPLNVSTAAVYRAFDETDAPARREPGGNDLEEAALRVAPVLATWRDRLADATGCRPRLAGSGATWFVEGTVSETSLDGLGFLEADGVRAAVVAVTTLPADDGGD